MGQAEEEAGSADDAAEAREPNAKARKTVKQNAAASAAKKDLGCNLAMAVRSVTVLLCHVYSLPVL